MFLTKPHLNIIFNFDGDMKTDYYFTHVEKERVFKTISVTEKYVQ